MYPVGPETAEMVRKLECKVMTTKHFSRTKIPAMHSSLYPENTPSLIMLH